MTPQREAGDNRAVCNFGKGESPQLPTPRMQWTNHQSGIPTWCVNPETENGLPKKCVLVCHCHVKILDETGEWTTNGESTEWKWSSGCLLERLEQLAVFQASMATLLKQDQWRCVSFLHAHTRVINARQWLVHRGSCERLYPAECFCNEICTMLHSLACRQFEHWNDLHGKPQLPDMH